MKSNYFKDQSQCIICDLDGTLSLFDRTAKNAFHRDFENDEVSEPVQLILDLYMCRFPNRKVFFFSGRNDKFRNQTVAFLKDRCFFQDDEYTLIMRKDGDYRKDSVVKQEMYDNFIKGRFSVNFVIDDRKQVKEMWVKNGLFVFDVNQKDEIF